MIADAILQEHAYRAITGNGLLIGRQTMPFNPEEAKFMVKRRGFVPGGTIEIDTQTRYSEGKGFISDRSFFSLFCDAKFRSLDVTDYEGADIVHNMHDPIPDSLIGTVDFLWNGSCLDNMSDPIMAMRNCVHALKPGGRMMLMEMGSPHHNAYTMYSPAWFVDFFAINGFRDCKVYICLFNPDDVHEGPYDVVIWKRFEGTLYQFPIQWTKGKALLSFVIAEKGGDVAVKAPVQGQYRANHDEYRKGFERFQLAGRPLWTLTKPALKRFAYRKFNHPDFEFLGTTEVT